MIRLPAGVGAGNSDGKCRGIVGSYRARIVRDPIVRVVGAGSVADWPAPNAVVNSVSIKILEGNKLVG